VNPYPNDSSGTSRRADGEDSYRENVLSDEHKIAVCLYDLLDTLVAMRMDLSNGSPEGVAAQETLGPKKVIAVHMMLDHAIESTKHIIGRITRPSPPL